MIDGIPFLGENNTHLKYKILNRKPDTFEEISLYSLYKDVEPNKKIVIIDSKWITWLEDTNFDYLKHTAYLKYYTYKRLLTSYKINLKDISKDENHLEYTEDGQVYVRYAYKLNKLSLNIGSKLLIYNIDTDILTEYTITSFVDTEFTFSILQLYELYKNACYKDTGHNSGYTLIYKEIPQFKNIDAVLRKENSLDTWDDKKSSSYHSRNDDVGYRDVRIYEYNTFIEKFGTGYIEGKYTYKYRKLFFESYLYCAMRADIVPIDGKEYNWDTLGKSRSYIKIKDAQIPFFIKCEWLDHNTLESKMTWRK